MNIRGVLNQGRGSVMQGRDLGMQGRVLVIHRCDLVIQGRGNSTEVGREGRGVTRGVVSHVDVT